MKNLIYLFAVLLFFASCSGAKNILFQIDEAARVQTDVTVDVRDNKYQVIKPGDKLLLRNLTNSTTIIRESANQFNVGSLVPQVELMVSVTGFATIPVYGEIELAGLTTIEATKIIEGLYGKEILSPVFDLSIISMRVKVLGEVARPGDIFLDREKLTIIDILSRAGGITVNGKKNNVKLIRGDLSNPIIKTFDLTKLSSLQDEFRFLQDDDIIYVEPNSALLYSENNRFFNTFLQPLTLVLNTILIIITLSNK